MSRALRTNAKGHIAMRPLATATFVAAVSIAAGLATPAAAATLKRHQAARSAPGGQFYQALPSGGEAADPTGVYVGGQLVGRDPDPNVRQQLRSLYSSPYHPGAGG